jgi:hypothetical protein
MALLDTLSGILLASNCYQKLPSTSCTVGNLHLGPFFKSCQFANGKSETMEKLDRFLQQRIFFFIFETAWLSKSLNCSCQNLNPPLKLIATKLALATSFYLMLSVKSMYVCMYVCIYVCMYVYMFVCLYVCLYANRLWLLRST